MIDGRQRLEALEEFSAGRLTLAEDFYLLEEVQDLQMPLLDELGPGKGRFAGFSLADLRATSPDLAYRFLDFDLPVSVVDTDDTELIEELFFRLNEGVPLNPAEKRTRGELLRSQIFPLVRDEDLFSCAGFRNVRRKYEDLLLRLLFVKFREGTVHDVPDMKRTSIDEFASSFRPPNLGQGFDASQRAEAEGRLNALVQEVRPTLTAMNEIFEDGDVLLRHATTFLIYYLVIDELIRTDATLPTRESFEKFNEDLQSLSGTDEEALTPDQRDALEYTAPLRETTTGSYTQAKAQILLRYLLGELQVKPS